MKLLIRGNMVNFQQIFSLRYLKAPMVATMANMCPSCDFCTEFIGPRVFIDVPERLRKTVFFFKAYIDSSLSGPVHNKISD